MNTNINMHSLIKSTDEPDLPPLANPHTDYDNQYWPDYEVKLIIRIPNDWWKPKCLLLWIVKMHKWFDVILFAESITLDVDTLIKQNQPTRQTGMLSLWY